ncbi:DUF6207 family protein [Streptomyces sp. NPDC055287]
MRCGRWAAATSDPTTRDPGQLSVRLRCLDVRQKLSTQPPARRCSADLPWSGRYRSGMPGSWRGRSSSRAWNTSPTFSGRCSR